MARVRVYYNADGWVCDRYPQHLPITDDCNFVDVSEDEYLESLSTNDHFAWKVFNGCLVMVQFEPIPQEKQLQKLREDRIALLDAFDKWEKAVLRGREEDDLQIMRWYKDLLDLQPLAFRQVPARVAHYLPQDETIREEQDGTN